MKMKSLRQAILLAAVLAGTAALAVSPALAQAPPGPPVCGGVASLMNHSIFKEGPGPLGDNIVSIPAVSPINNNPTNPTTNGFFDLCKRFGLLGTTTAILQFNALTGSITTFTCSSGAAPDFTPGQAVLIRPSANASGRIPGVECSRPYTSYKFVTSPKGDNLFPTPVTLAGGGLPLTTTSGGAKDLCVQLGLPAGTEVKDFDAAAGTINTFTCAAVTTPAANALRLGEGVLIRPPATSTGSPVIF